MYSIEYICRTQNKLQQKQICYHQKLNFMLNNILNVQENRPRTKKVVNLLHKVLYFKMYVIIASMINRFEETTALKSLDQRKYYVAVFASNIQKNQEHLENFNNFSLLVISEVDPCQHLTLIIPLRQLLTACSVCIDSYVFVVQCLIDVCSS